MRPEPQDGLLPAGLDRRLFLGGAAATAAAAALPTPAWADHHAEASLPDLCVFIKFVQSLSYDEMAQRLAAIGFDGIESTVRAKGHVLPERVKEDLPKQYEAVKRAGMDITIMTTDVVEVDQPYTEDVLRIGAELGIRKYRMGFWRYDPNRGVMEQLDELRPKVKELAALNRELGLTAVYQNHCGKKYVGAPIWDLHYLLRDIDPQEIGMAFDLRHATIEGGLSWPLQYDIMKPHLGALFVKDFVWGEKKEQHVPLGEGRVDKTFYKKHLKEGPNVPISLHVEYLKNGDAEENLAAITRDYKTLRKWLGA
ncbi:Xylose isomerase-like TIM barrel [Planctomycetes bacterium MalM25]|nr:Xylose isomerase-like TIM barrel [Planctomycetes bacterium MalM25]